MAPRNIEKDKDIKEAIEQKITSILVVNNSKLKPFIELFETNPENILMKPLGTLFGFFKINDTSEDSSYIVNFLTSILKKEYYANHKRSISDSFDSALKKVNLALSELAKQGNINWLGKLSGSVCVVEKNNFHFTVCGQSSILLLRDGMISEISKDLAADLIEPNPLKTFVDVSSGKLLPKDKIMVTTEDLFNLFSMTEIKKSALRFSNEKFSQFIKTALVNELKVAGTIVMDISEPIAEPEIKPLKAKKKREENVNVFSEKTFREANRVNINDSPVLNSKTNKKSDYVDKKTGHIYIQGDDQPVEKENETWQRFKDFMSDALFNFKEKSKVSISRKFKKLKNWMIEKKEIEKIEISEKINTEPVNIFEKPILNEITIEDAQKIQNDKNKTTRIEVIQKSSISDIFAKIWHGIKFFFSKIIPSFGKIRNVFGFLSKKQKISAIVILLAIVIVPLIYVKYEKKTQEPSEQPVQEVKQQTTAEILAGEKNLKALSVQDLGLKEKATNLVSIKGENFAISQNKVISLKDQQEFVSSDIANIQFTSNMDDLNLVFLMDSSGKTVSFSPVSSGFKTNNIVIESNFEIKGIAAYSTYLYLADAANNQIYRYPRAEGGFGAKTNWLKDFADIKNIKGIAVDENLYLLKDNHILKFYQGRQQEANFEAPKIEVRYSSIYTNSNTQNIYVLDSKYGRIIKYSKTGEILGQYQNDQLKDSLNFSIDEQNNKLYFISSNSNVFDAILN